MADGKWVNVPGKGRRWQQPSGELMREQPGWGFVGAQLQSGLQSIANPFGLLGDRPRMTPEQMRRSTSGAPFIPSAAAATLPAGGVSADPRVHNAATGARDLAALREGQNAAIRAYAPSPAAPSETFGTAGSSWTTHVTPAGSAQDSEVRRMMQQYDPSSYWEKNTAIASAATGAGEAAQAARQPGPLADVADTSNPASQAYWDRADIQAWAGANKGLAAALRKKHGLPEDYTARILAAQPAGEFASTPEQRAVAEAGYAGVTVDPSVTAGMGGVTPGAFNKSEVFGNPQIEVSQQSLPAPAAPGTPAAQMNFSEPYLNPNEIRQVNLEGNDALQAAVGSQAAKAAGVPMGATEPQRQAAEAGYGGVKDPLLSRYLGMARGLQNATFPR